MRARAVAIIFHSVHQLAIGDASGRKKAIVAAHQILHAQHYIKVVAHRLAALNLLPVARPELALQFTAHALQRACR